MARPMEIVLKYLFTNKDKAVLSREDITSLKNEIEKLEPANSEEMYQAAFFSGLLSGIWKIPQTPSDLMNVKGNYTLSTDLPITNMMARYPRKILEETLINFGLRINGSPVDKTAGRLKDDVPYQVEYVGP